MSFVFRKNITMQMEFQLETLKSENENKFVRSVGLFNFDHSTCSTILNLNHFDEIFQWNSWLCHKNDVFRIRSQTNGLRHFMHSILLCNQCNAEFSELHICVVLWHLLSLAHAIFGKYSRIVNQIHSFSAFEMVFNYFCWLKKYEQKNYFV